MKKNHYLVKTNSYQKRLEESSNTPLSIKPLCPTGFHPPRKWQSEAFSVMAYKKVSLCLATMGSGKTRQINMMACDYAENGIKSLIAAPSTSIKEQSVDGKFIDTHGCRVISKNQVTRKNSSKHVYDFLIEDYNPAWVKKDNIKYFSQHALNTTHQTLNKILDFWIDSGFIEIKDGAVTILEDWWFKKYLYNVAFLIDECHRLCERYYKDQKGNRKVVKNTFNHFVDIFNKYGHSIHLFTGTYIREYLNEMVMKLPETASVYELSFLRYLEECCQYLKRVNFYTMFFKSERENYYIDAVLEIIRKDPSLPTIMYIAPTGSKRQFADKHIEVKEMIEKLSKEDYPHRVLDLVTGSIAERQKRLQAAVEYFRKHGKYAHNIVIAMQMATEGTDLPYLCRSIVIGERSSMTFFLQGPFGRIVRDIEGKEEVNVYNVIPYFFNVINSEEDVVAIDRANKKFMTQCLMHDLELFNPTPKLVKNLKIKGKEYMLDKSDKSFSNTVSEHENMLRHISRKIYNEIYNSRNNILALNTTKAKWKYVKELAYDVAIENNCTKEEARNLSKKAIDNYGCYALKVNGSDANSADVTIVDYEKFCPIDGVYNKIIKHQMTEVEFRDYNRRLKRMYPNELEMGMLVKNKVKELNRPLIKEDGGELYKMYRKMVNELGFFKEYES